MLTSFSINLHDNEGDIYDDGIFLHISDSTIIRFKTIDELEQFAKDLINRTIPEIKENLNGNM